MELEALAAAVPAIVSLVGQAVSAVERVQSGRRAKNEEVRSQLEEVLKRLRDNLKQTAELAELGEDYFAIYASIQEVKGHCLELRAHLASSRDTLSSKDSAGHEDAWKTTKVFLDQIDADFNLGRDELQDSVNYLNGKDAHQCHLLVSQFRDLRTEAGAFADENSGGRLPDLLSRMISTLRELENIFSQSLRAGILRGLARLKGDD